MSSYSAYSQFNRWSFTIENYSVADLVKLAELDYLYLVYALNDGTLNGFMTFRQSKRLSTLKKLLPNAAFTSSFGLSSADASARIKTLGDYYEIGVCPRQGSRTDIYKRKNPSLFIPGSPPMPRQTLF